MAELAPLPIAAPIARFTKLAGISRTRTYKLLKTGELRSVVMGGRRLILMESFLEMLRRLDGGTDGGGNAGQ